MIKRYYLDCAKCEMVADENHPHEWVKYNDIKHLLQNNNKQITVYHDKDGKLYTYDENGNVEWLFEVMIDQGDNVAKIVNNLLMRPLNDN